MDFDGFRWICMDLDGFHAPAGRPADLDGFHAPAGRAAPGRPGSPRQPSQGSQPSQPSQPAGVEIVEMIKILSFLNVSDDYTSILMRNDQFYFLRKKSKFF